MDQTADLFSPKQTKTKIAKAFWLNHLVFSLLGLGVFLVMIAGAGFYFWNKNFSQDNLANLVPVDTVVYFYARNSIWDYLGQDTVTLDGLPYNNFYQTTPKDFAAKLLPLASQTAYAQFLVDGELAEVWLFQLKHAIANNEASFAFELPGFKVFDKKFLAISDSASALAKIEQVYQGEIFSLASQIEEHQAPAQLFIGTQNLKTYLNQTNSTRHKILSQAVTENLVFSFKKHQDAWLINLNRDLIASQVKNSELVTALPADFGIFISHFNLLDILSHWAAVDQTVSDIFKQTQEVYQAVFNFDLSLVKAEVFNHPADLIIFPASTPTALGLDYILVTTEPDATGRQSLEDLVKVFLAQKLPQKALRYLPDGSSVVELSADTNAWQWADINIGDGNRVARFVAEPELKFEIYYMVESGKLIVSNSSARLASFFSHATMSISGYKELCPKDIFTKSYVIFAQKSQVFSLNEFLPNKTLILGKNQGCLVN